MPNSTTTKVVMSDRSQAVRLPKAFRFKTEKVRILDEGSAIILEPIETDWSWLEDLHNIGPLDPDVVDAAEAFVSEQVRSKLEEL